MKDKISFRSVKYKAIDNLNHEDREVSHIYWHYIDHSQEEMIFMRGVLNDTKFKVLITNLSMESIDNFDFEYLFYADSFECKTLLGERFNYHIFYKKVMKDEELI